MNVSDSAFEFYPIGGSEAWESLCQHLTESTSTARQCEVDVLRRVCAVARSHGSNFAVLERRYVDRDFRAEFSAVYSRVHVPPQQSDTSRLHFFKASEVPSATIEDLLSQLDRKSVTYQGFVVLRPLEVGRVGRCHLRIPNWPDDQVRVTCRSELSGHLLGSELPVDGCPFIHQEAMVMVCAEAAMWTAVRFLYHRFDHALFLPPQITEEAYRNFAWAGRPLPTGGLTYEQMMNALSHMGYSPVGELFGEGDGQGKASEVLRWITPYLDSELPVILIVPGHAVCCIGYVLAPERQAAESDVQSTSDWGCGIVVHDDAVGPYRVIVRDSDDVAPGTPGFPVSSEFLDEGDLGDVIGAIVPLPDRVYMNAADVEKRVRTLLRPDDSEDPVGAALADLPRGFPAEIRTAAGEWLACQTLGGAARFVVRTYLVDTMEYLAALDSVDFEWFSQTASRYYRTCHWPRAIWVTEVTTNERMNAEDAGKRTVLGEVITDPTANRYGTVFLAIHAPGVIVDFQSDQRLLLADDKPYRFGGERTYPRRRRPM